jgi:hypothetical protein
VEFLPGRSQQAIVNGVLHQGVFEPETSALRLTEDQLLALQCQKVTCYGAVEPGRIDNELMGKCGTDDGGGLKYTPRTFFKTVEAFEQQIFERCREGKSGSQRLVVDSAVMVAELSLFN